MLIYRQFVRPIFYFALKVLYATRVLQALFRLREIYRPRLRVLMFHRVYGARSVGLPAIGISQENYSKLIEIVNNDLKTISIEELMSDKIVSKGRVLITFDDAYQEIYEFALPYLKRSELPAVIFPVIDGLYYQEQFWWDVVYAFLYYSEKYTVLPFQNEISLPEQTRNKINHILTKVSNERGKEIYHLIDEMKGYDRNLRQSISNIMADAYNKNLSHNGLLPRSIDLNTFKHQLCGQFSIGSHTVTHEFLNLVPSSEVISELSKSKRVLEEITKRKIISFAYPSGIYTSEITDLVREAGYSFAFTTEHGANHNADDSLRLRRININDDFVCDDYGHFSHALTYWRLLKT